MSAAIRWLHDRVKLLTNISEKVDAAYEVHDAELGRKRYLGKILDGVQAEIVYSDFLEFLLGGGRESSTALKMLGQRVN